MRCRERTGFLMIHACENEALYACAYCGKNLCQQHAIRIAAPPTALVGTPPGTQAPPPAGGTLTTGEMACRDCLKKQGTAYDDDPYYRRYPYYGGYHPYYYNNYDDRDRRVFDQNSGTHSQPGETPDALGS